MSVKKTITKKFHPIPIAHRQPNHAAHCKFIHGHDWNLEVEVEEGDALEPGTNFIFDYGAFKDFKRMVWDQLDHACLVPCNENGEALDDVLEELAAKGLIKPYYLPDVTAEGLTEYLFAYLSGYVADRSSVGARVVRVTVWEGENNSCTMYATD